LRRRDAGVENLGSDVELEVDHVAVADDVFLALEGELRVGAAGGLGAELDEVFPPDDFGLDEAALEVGVDGVGGSTVRRPSAS
jgi:hypothetical protein